MSDTHSEVGSSKSLSVSACQRENSKRTVLIASMHVCYGASSGHGGEWRSFMQCLAYWEKVKGAERWGPEWSLRALAAAQRVQLSLSAFADNIYNLVQPHAESFK